MATLEQTLEQIRLAQLLQPFEGPQGIASFNPLAFQFQDQLYPQSNNTMAKNIMSNFETQLYPQSEEMRDAQILMNQPDTVFTNSVRDPAFSIKNLAGYDYDPYLATKDNFNFNYNVGTRPAFLRTNTPLDMNRFQGVSDMSLIDETTNDEQDQEYIDQVDQSNNKFGGLMDLIGNIAIPGYGFFKNMAKGGLEGLRGFGRKLGQSDFAQSKNHMEYLGKRQARKERERLAPIEKQLRETSERSGGYQPTTKSQNVARTDSRVSNGKTRAYGL